MKIALAIERFSRHGGGAESYAVELARTLVNEGWEVHLFGHEWDREPEAARFHEIQRLPKWVPRSARILHFALSHRAQISREHFDVVLGFGNTIAMNVYQSHGGVHFLSNIRKIMAVRNPVLRLVKRLGLRLTPKYHARAWIESAPFRKRPKPVIVAISDMVRDDMAEYFRVDRGSIRLVYNGIDGTRFGAADPGAREEVRRSLGFSDDRVLFLFMAYDFAKKGVRNLVEAAGIVRDRMGADRFGVVVVGRQPSASLERLTRRLHLDGTVVFPGSTKQPERFYAACDVFILPTFYDACSLVVFEAMAAGLPAITTVFNGAAGIITSGTDGLVLQDPRDCEEMAAAMMRCLDPDFLRAASDVARRTASRYTLEANHRQMLSIFREVSGSSIARD